MRPLEPDVLELIHRQFLPRDHDKVIDVLRQDALSTARAQRAVLFLCGGSLSMLNHYAESARRDVRQVLERAEYVLDVAGTPVQVRDFVAPLPGAAHAPAQAPRRKGLGLGRMPAARRGAGLRLPGDSIKRASFQLGKARYVVLDEPGESQLVPCIRRCGNVITLMRLPLMFVMEQICEHIELADVSG